IHQAVLLYMTAAGNIEHTAFFQHDIAGPVAGQPSQHGRQVDRATVDILSATHIVGRSTTVVTPKAAGVQLGVGTDQNAFRADLRKVDGSTSNLNNAVN